MTGLNTKNKVAAILRKSSGWLSGEAISAELGISRAAVAKHVNSLRDEGFLIDSASRRGYLLKIEPDTIDLKLIAKSLKTKIIGKGEWQWLPETTSTNRAGAIGAAGGMADGSLIMAERQTTGRGRRGRQWFSPPRSIFFSTLLRPKFPAEKLPWLMIAATAAVHKTVSALVKGEANIKWPNDVMVDNCKLAGILVESGLAAGELEWAVVGIGLNVNVEVEEFPAELQSHTTSVFEAAGQETFSRNALYAEIINSLDNFYLKLLKGESGELAAYWQQAAGFIGRDITVRSGDVELKGKALGLNADGRLILGLADGSETIIESADYLPV